MTREEAIKELQESHDMMRSYNIDESESRLMTALNMAIKALEQEPSEDMTIAYLMGYYADKEPCDDAVSRQYLIDIATKDGAYDYVSAQEIANAPSVRPQEPKTGRWMATEDYETLEINGYFCSVCDLPMETEEQTDYCPNCGAKMFEPQESEDKG